jgi:phosphoribosylanthranilate isomerase
VFVNVERPDDVAAAANAAGIRVLQLHGDETAAYCRALAGWTMIKAVRIGVSMVEADFREYPVQGILLDSKDDLQFGGTGKAFDWSITRSLGTFLPLILAGGLRPANVAQAIRSVMPYAVDVCSGVENSPRSKDAGKLKAFMDEVRNVGKEVRHGTR